MDFKTDLEKEVETVVVSFKLYNNNVKIVLTKNNDGTFTLEQFDLVNTNITPRDKWYRLRTILILNFEQPGMIIPKENTKIIVANTVKLTDIEKKQLGLNTDETQNEYFEYGALKKVLDTDKPFEDKLNGGSKKYKQIYKSRRVRRKSYRSRIYRK